VQFVDVVECHRVDADAPSECDVSFGLAWVCEDDIKMCVRDVQRCDQLQFMSRCAVEAESADCEETQDEGIWVALDGIVRLNISQRPSPARDSTFDGPDIYDVKSVRFVV
jgi:hypothetical protein